MDTTNKKLLRHQLKTSGDLSATTKNVSPSTSFGGTASNLVWGILRGIELDIKTTFFIPTPCQKYLGLNQKISSSEEFQLQPEIPLELEQV